MRHLLPDIAGYVRTASRRVVNKAGQRLLGKAVFDTIGAATVNDPALVPSVRASGAFALTLDPLKDAGLFAAELEPADVGDRHVGRVLNLGLSSATSKGTRASSG